MAVSILNEMMTSMQKSKAALEQLANLNFLSQEHDSSSSGSSEVQATKQLSTLSAAMAETYGSSNSRKHDTEFRRDNKQYGQSLSFDDLRVGAGTQPSTSRPVASRGYRYQDQDQEEREGEEGEEQGDGWEKEEEEERVKRNERGSEPWSPAASLHARYMQLERKEKGPQFSPQNKHLADIAIAVTQDPGSTSSNRTLDPLHNLQRQLQGEEESALKRLSASSTPSKYQFHYNDTGYVWEGIRYDRGQGVVSRLCLAQGLLIKVQSLLFFKMEWIGLIYRPLCHTVFD